jgi:hypothetical protein
VSGSRGAPASARGRVATSGPPYAGRRGWRRDDFPNALSSLLRGEDPAFEAFARGAGAEERGAAAA